MTHSWLLLIIQIFLNEKVASQDGAGRTARSVRRGPTATTAAASTSRSSASAMTDTTDRSAKLRSAEKGVTRRT